MKSHNQHTPKEDLIKVCINGHDLTKLGRCKASRGCVQCHRDNMNKRTKRFTDFMTIVKSKPCSDCKISYHPFVMDFDHLDNKTRAVSRMGQWTIQAVQKEIDKCELVCANCHRLRTYRRATCN